jgi:hypothetical protein
MIMRNDLRIALYLVAGCVGVGILAVLFWTIQAYPQIGFVIAGCVGVVALLAFVQVVYLISNRIHAHRNQIATRNLALQAEQARIDRERQRDERAWQAEQHRLQIEQQERQQQWYLEQRRLELEDRKIKLAAYQAQAVQVGKGQSLVIRDYNGLDSRVAYEPRVQVREEWKDTELVSESELGGLLPAPRPRSASAIELLRDGELDGSDLVLGTDQSGQLVRRTWKQVMCMLILGLMGGGKTNTALWIVFQLLLKGYKVALIDRHAKSDESTHARLKDFSSVYDTPVGDSPAAAMRVVKHVRRVFEMRRDQGKPVTYSLAFVVDEFTATMRAMSDKESEWQPVAIELATLLEYLNTEGRKYGVYPICIGQAANASRSGGTEIRDLFHTRIIHAMRARQAQMLGLTDEKKAIQKLETGQVYLDIDGKDDPFAMIVPEVTEEFKQAVLTRLLSRRTETKLVLHETFDAPLVRSSDGEVERSRRTTEGFVNAVPKTPEGIEETAFNLPEVVQRVLDLRKAKANKAEIILEVWNAKVGSSAAYKKANEEYAQIIENLTELGYLEAQ